MRFTVLGSPGYITVVTSNGLTLVYLTKQQFEAMLVVALRAWPDLAIPRRRRRKAEVEG